MASSISGAEISPASAGTSSSTAALTGDPKKDGVTADQVHSHESDKSCWIAIDGIVYDVTRFLGDHPGGWQEILAFAGCDATAAFNDAGHSRSARKMLGDYLIGPLRPGEAAKLRKSRPAGAGGGGSKDSGCSIQ